MKTRKSLTKRFKITKNGKVLRRASGQNHYKSKKSGKQVRESRKWIPASKPIAKKVRKSLPSKIK